MNNENLKTPTSAEAKERGRKGGLASGRKRRTRRKLATIFKDYMNRPNERGDIRAELAAAGIELDEETTNAAVLAASIIMHAMQGDMKAARLVLQLAGEDPELEYKKQRDREMLELRQRVTDAKLAVDPFADDPRISFIMPPMCENCPRRDAEDTASE